MARPSLTDPVMDPQVRRLQLPSTRLRTATTNINSATQLCNFDSVAWWQGERLKGGGLNFGLSKNCLKISFLWKKFCQKMHNLRLKIPFGKNLGTKLSILSEICSQLPVGILSEICIACRKNPRRR